MNINEIYEILDRFEKSSLSEIELEIDKVKIAAKKPSANAVPVMAPQMPVSMPVAAPASANSTATATESAPQAAPVAEDANLTIVKAPLAGTFYRAPKADAEPFVQVGQTVEEGDVLGLIEAMKLMNNITAPISGVVEQIYAENEELVGFDSALIAIRSANV